MLWFYLYEMFRVGNPQRHKVDEWGVGVGKQGVTAGREKVAFLLWGMKMS